MNRWKREFRAWAKKRGYHAVVCPKKAEDWANAQRMTELLDFVMNQPLQRNR